MKPASGTAVLGSRRLLVASLLLGVFVLFDLGLLGWLIFRSLSRREIEQVLLETRAEAEGLAEQIAGNAEQDGRDLFTLIAQERERQTYIDSILSRREIVKTFEIRDAEGRLVFRAQGESFEPPLDGTPRLEDGEVPENVEITTSEHSETREYDMEVPIGELGVIQIGISRVEMERRIGVLRRELVRQTALIGAVTVSVLLLAYLTIWWLWRRGRRFEEQATEAERMAYVGTLASGLAHEIRNPLNSLNLNMQLLEEEACTQLATPSSRRLLAITQQEIGRLGRLVDDFLSYARPRPLELEKLPAVELLNRCRELLAREIEGRRAKVVVEDLSGGARVEVDPEQMTQLLLNLLQNSLAATEGIGRPPSIRLTASRHGGRVVLEVEDNGVGIPAKELGRIFDLFYSTRKGGTGLGLAVVQRIARAHGGDVGVDSTPGVGTRMRVSLPALAEGRQRVAVEPPLARVHQG